MSKLVRLLPALAVLVALLALPAQAAPPPGPYFNGFESNTAGWFGYGGSTITRTHSGTAASYANGIASASGNWHARLGTGDNWTCSGGGGTLDWFPGPYTNWGGYSSTFPSGGYRTAVDIYLDVPWAIANPDRRFDWSSAINMPDGTFRRDFVFNVGTMAGFVITGGNNANRCGADPYSVDPTHGPRVQIINSGWYTFEHRFTGVPGGVLTVTMTLTQKSTGTVMGTWVRSDPSDIIGVTVGGNRYGWFAQNEIAQLAIDNSLRTGLCRNGGGEGDVEDKDSHRQGHAKFSANGCEGGDQGGNVEERDGNNEFHSDKSGSTTFTSQEDSQTVTMVGTGFHNGLPVGFTMIAIDNGTLAPAVFTLILTDGYSISGNLVSGALSIV